MQGERVEEINAVLEWDKKRGVLYVHNKRTGASVLRICGMRECNSEVTLEDGQIDIAIRLQDAGLHPVAFISYPVEELA